MYFAFVHSFKTTYQCGINSHLLINTFRRLPPKVLPKRSTVNVLTLKDLRSIFVLWLLGLVIAFIRFLYEVLCKLYGKQTRRKVHQCTTYFYFFKKRLKRKKRISNYKQTICGKQFFIITLNWLFPNCFFFVFQYWQCQKVENVIQTPKGITG